MGTKKTDRELVADMLIRMEALLAMGQEGPFCLDKPGDDKDAYELFLAVESSEGREAQLCYLLRSAMEDNRVDTFIVVSFIALSVLASRRCVLTEGAFAEPKHLLPVPGPQIKLKLPGCDENDQPIKRAPSGDEWFDAANDYLTGRYLSEGRRDGENRLKELHARHLEAR